MKASRFYNLNTYDNISILIDDLSQSFNIDNDNYIIPGGTTSKEILKAFKIFDKKKKTVNIFLTDERIVPHKSNFSNFGNIFKDISSSFYIKCHSWVDQKGLLVSQNNLEMFKNNIISNDFETLLGVGLDGHIASLFPSDPFFRMGEFYKIIRNENEKFMRFSLTASFLLLSKKIRVIFFGKQKKIIFKHINEGNNNIPVVYLLNECKKKNIEVTLYTTNETIN